eukprot:6665246-Prymnesium_polylepis.1
MHMSHFQRSGEVCRRASGVCACACVRAVRFEGMGWTLVQWEFLRAHFSLVDLRTWHPLKYGGAAVRRVCGDVVRGGANSFEAAFGSQAYTDSLSLLEHVPEMREALWQFDLEV